MPDFSHVQPQFNVLLDVSCAMVPLVFSLLLFRANRQRTGLWWAGICVWVAFLPTAPYTLTDIIHLIAAIREQPPLSVQQLVLLWIPACMLYMLVCFQAYGISLLMLDQYLFRQKLGHWILPAEIALSVLSAIGIYLGRVQRLSSWDLVLRPFEVIRDLWRDVMLHQFVVFIIEASVIILVGYMVVKIIDLAVWQTYYVPQHARFSPSWCGKGVLPAVFPSLRNTERKGVAR